MVKNWSNILEIILNLMVMVLMDKIIPIVLKWDTFKGSYMRPIIVLASTLIWAQLYVFVKERGRHVYQKTHQ